MIPNNAWGSPGTAQNGTGEGNDLLALGGIVLQPVYQDVIPDPFDGTQRNFHFRGTPANLSLAQAFALANGWQSRIETQNSPWPILTITIPNPGSSEYTVRWQFRTEMKQQDLFINIGIVNFLQNAGLSLSQILNYKQTMTGWLNDGTSYDDANTDLNNDDTLGPGGVTALSALYQFMLMGGQYVEVAQPVISRKATYDAFSYTGPVMTTRNTQTIYSTPALIANYGIPADVQAQIEADPITVPVANFAYSWKLRKNDLDIIPAKNKITEEVEWTWDQWSTVAYNLVT